MKVELKDDVIVVECRIDSITVDEFNQKVTEIISGMKEEEPVTLDFDNMNYISSAGLRALLLIIQGEHPLTIKNVCSEVNEVFEVTGFSELMDVETK